MSSPPELIESPASELRAWYQTQSLSVKLHLALEAKSLYPSCSLGERIDCMDRALRTSMNSPLARGAAIQTLAFVQAFSESLEPLSTAAKWAGLNRICSDKASPAELAQSQKALEALELQFVSAATALSKLTANVLAPATVHRWHQQFESYCCDF